MLSNSDASTVALYLTAPQPHQVNGAPLSPEDAHFQIAEAKASDAPDDPAAVSQPARRTILERTREQGDFRKFAAARAACATAHRCDHGRRSHRQFCDRLLHACGARLSAPRRCTRGSRSRTFRPKPSEITVTVSGDDKPLGTAKTSLGPRETGVVEFPFARPREGLPGRTFAQRWLPARQCRLRHRGFGEIGIDPVRQPASRRCARPRFDSRA